MNRFFRLTASAYESVRAEMDTESGYPNEQADTWFTPAADAPKDENGNCLIAAIPPVADRLAEVGEEISEEQYQAALPQVNLTEGN